MKKRFGEVVTEEKKVFENELSFEENIRLAYADGKLTPILKDINIYHIDDPDGDVNYLITEYDKEKQEIISSERYSKDDILEYGWDKVEEWIIQDTERKDSYGEKWFYIGIMAEATVLIPFLSRNKVNFKIAAIQSGGLWGVESDIGYDYGYIEQEEKNQVDELLGYLNTLNVNTVGFKA